MVRLFGMLEWLVALHEYHPLLHDGRPYDDDDGTTTTKRRRRNDDDGDDEDGEVYKQTLTLKERSGTML